MVAEFAGEHTPFDYAQTSINVAATPGAVAIARQNWDEVVTSATPLHVGEIVHVFAVGLGVVSPEAPDGAPAPSSEPFARLAAPLVCPGAEVLYAGLAPGSLERIYQLDLRLASAGRGLQCSTGAKILTLELNIQP